MPTPSIVYSSFDSFPSPKGAATHIAAFAEALGAAYHNVDLVTLPGREGVELDETFQSRLLEGP